MIITGNSICVSELSLNNYIVIDTVIFGEQPTKFDDAIGVDHISIVGGSYLFQGCCWNMKLIILLILLYIIPLYYHRIIFDVDACYFTKRLRFPTSILSVVKDTLAVINRTQKFRRRNETYTIVAIQKRIGYTTINIFIIHRFALCFAHN